MKTFIKKLLLSLVMMAVVAGLFVFANFTFESTSLFMKTAEITCAILAVLGVSTGVVAFVVLIWWSDEENE